MRASVLALTLGAALVAASDVHDLKKDTFEPFIKEHDLVLAECEISTHSCAPVTQLTPIQSSHHGVATAKLWRLSTRKLRQH
jgi:hypothetical protein